MQKQSVQIATELENGDLAITAWLVSSELAQRIQALVVESGCEKFAQWLVPAEAHDELTQASGLLVGDIGDEPITPTC